MSAALERLRLRRRELARELHAATRGRAVLTPKARSLMARIDDIDARIEQLTNPGHFPLSELLPDHPEARNQIYGLLTAIPIAADLVYDLLIQLRDTVNALGVEECTFTNLIDKLRTQVERIVFMVSPDMPGLHDVLADDDAVISDLELLLTRYVNTKCEAILMSNPSSQKK